jgi:hypothetical protein
MLASKGGCREKTLDAIIIERELPTHLREDPE